MTNLTIHEDNEPRSMVSTARTAGDIKAQKKIIKDVMESVMKDGTHYGPIPGTGEKKALLKPGTECLASTFRLAINHETEDLSTDDSVRYRVRSIVSYSPSGQVLGDGVGECSSDEKKYRWRKAICDEEWDDADADRRRESWHKGWKNSPPYKVKQIRTDPADIANTVLKMAAKRADAAAILLVLGASDIFAQDIDEWDEDMLAAMAGEGKHVKQPERKSTKKAAPKKKKAPPKKKTAAPKKEAPPEAPPEPPDDPTPPWDDADTDEIEVEGEIVDEGEGDLDDDVIRGYVMGAKVVKTGKSSHGEWTLYVIKIDEDEFKTFDDDLFAVAEELARDRSACIYTYEPTERGPKLTAIKEAPPF